MCGPSAGRLRASSKNSDTPPHRRLKSCALSPALAMTWELWGKNRAGITACIALIGAGYVAYWRYYLPNKWKDIWLPLEPRPSSWFQYLYLAAIVTHPEFLLRNPSAGFSMRKFTLPMSTTALVSWNMLFGCVGLVLLWMANYLMIWLSPARIEPAWWLLPLLDSRLPWYGCRQSAGASLVLISCNCWHCG